MKLHSLYFTLSFASFMYTIYGKEILYFLLGLLDSSTFRLFLPPSLVANFLSHTHAVPYSILQHPSQLTHFGWTQPFTTLDGPQRK